MGERSALLRDADEVARKLVDNIHDQVESLPASARPLWWEAFLTSVFAMTAASTSYKEALRVFDRVHINAHDPETEATLTEDLARLRARR